MEVCLGDGCIVRILKSNCALPGPGGILLGLGRAPGGVRDAEPLFRARPDCRVMAINDRIGSPCPDRTATWPHRLDFAASVHGLELPGWLENRAAQGLNPPDAVFSVGKGPADCINFFLKANFPIGSSGFLPVVVGLFFLRVEAVVLSGMIFTGVYARYLKSWRIARANGLLERVYSLTPGALTAEKLVRPVPDNFFKREAA